MGDILTKAGFEALVGSAVQRLASVRYESTGAFVTTPVMYPSGGSVVVWISREPPYFRVSDYGFGHRECSIMGADRRQFMTRATPVAEAAGVTLANDGAFEVTVSEGQLEGAIKAIAACSQEVAMREWRPIETAPKDGDVLLYCAETNEQFVAFWGIDPDDGDTQWVFARFPGGCVVVRDPTHWMPLPAPPA